VSFLGNYARNVYRVIPKAGRLISVQSTRLIASPCTLRARRWTVRYLAGSNGGELDTFTGPEVALYKFRIPLTGRGDI
jgi:hypothetical protein